MSGVYLIASFPKSGNTWVRIALEAMLFPDRDIDLNWLAISMPVTFGWLEDLLGIEASELTPTELAAVRPWAFLRAASLSTGKCFLKVHDVYLPPVPGAAIPYPREAIAGVIYLIRDPRDVAVSLSHHSERPLVSTVARMAEPQGWIGPPLNASGPQFRQMVSSWSRHVESWVSDSHLPMLVCRYEDMLDDPYGSFVAIAAFAGLDVGAAVVRRAVEATRFERLQQLEKEKGFVERYGAERFFRTGRKGGWRTELPAALARRIEADHGAVMARFGYRPEADASEAAG